jgi:hypothetical protein
MSSDIVIDGALFLGMHHADDAIRRACKAFFAGHLDTAVTMSLEQVGYCDDVIWGYPREEQDAYYPFMDVLHTEMTIHRQPYTEADLTTARDAGKLGGLGLTRRLTVAVALNRGATLHTADPVLLDRPGLPVRPAAPTDEEAEFPPHLEKLYAASLLLRTGSRREA